MLRLLGLLLILTPSLSAQDWPMYNHDLLGTRYNSHETAINKTNAGQLVEKWRYPAKDSKENIGVIHATPIVVNGNVYFGTATDPTFYKLHPNGTLAWSYRNPAITVPALRDTEKPSDTSYINRRFQTSPNGILASALVANDTVYFVDIGGWVYSLDTVTGKERWKLSSKAKDFPDAHFLNCFFASPILADGKLILAGGTLEQVVAAFPGYKASSGRGFVMAPRSRQRQDHLEI